MKSAVDHRDYDF